MSIGHLYSDFGDAQYGTTPAEPGSDNMQLEEARLAAFEDGYQAGWDDATKAHEQDQQKALSDLSQTFEDMSFTYQEAFSKLTVAMQPLLTMIVTKLLPEVARKSLGAHILAEVAELLKTQSSGICEIAVAPAALTIVEDVATRIPQLPFRFSADPALEQGQAFIRNGDTEREINLDTIQESIAEAVAAFFEQTEREMQNG